jgi:hypothetical protein
MKVYHGSYIEIFEIDLSKSVINRDFGSGFYVTKLREQAEYWAIRKGRQYRTNGFVTEFQFSDVAFTSYGMNVLRFTEYTEEWLDFVVMNRTAEAPVNIHDYDIVEGPVANDDIATRITFYLEGGITKSEFIEELKFKRSVSHQIALCTQKSLQMIKKAFSKADLNEMTIDDAILQSLVVDFEMNDYQAIDAFFNSKTYSLLIDENTGYYKKSWQEIYEMLKKELKLYTQTTKK